MDYRTLDLKMCWTLVREFFHASHRLSSYIEQSCNDATTIHTQAQIIEQLRGELETARIAVRMGNLNYDDAQKAKLLHDAILRMTLRELRAAKDKIAGATEALFQAPDILVSATATKKQIKDALEAVKAADAILREGTVPPTIRMPLAPGQGGGNQTMHVRGALAGQVIFDDIIPPPDD